MRIIERISKCLMCLMVAPFMFIVMIFMGLLMFCLPIVALINPDAITFDGKKTNDQT